MWSQLLSAAKSKMGHSAQASKRQQNLVDRYAGQLENINKTEFSQEPIERKQGYSNESPTINLRN